MKISRFIAVGCLSLAVAGFSYQNSSYAEKSSLPFYLSQSNPQQDLSIKDKAEKMINLFFTEKFEDFATFALPELQPEVTPSRLREVLQEVTEENGKFVSIVESQVIDTIASDFVVVTLQFEKITEDWTFIFNDNKDLIGVNSPISKSVETIAQDFVEYVSNEDYGKARALLNPFLKDSIFPETIKKSWEKIIADNGKLEDVNISRTSNSPNDDTHAVWLELEFEKTEKEILIIFDSSKSIIGLDWVEQ